MPDLTKQYLDEVTTRLERLAGPNRSIDEAVQAIADSLDAGGVVQAFGTGHSEAFAMEIAGRAGGLIATNRIALRTLVLRGDRSVSELGGAEFERDPNVGENLLALFDVQPHDDATVAHHRLAVVVPVRVFALHATVDVDQLTHRVVIAVRGGR